MKAPHKYWRSQNVREVSIYHSEGLVWYKKVVLASVEDKCEAKKALARFNPASLDSVSGPYIQEKRMNVLIRLWRR